MSTFVLKYLKPNDFYNSYLNSGSGSGSGNSNSNSNNNNGLGMRPDEASEGYKRDKCGYRPCKLTMNPYNTNILSKSCCTSTSMYNIGNTSVLCGVNYSVGTPDVSCPDVGQVSISVTDYNMGYTPSSVPVDTNPNEQTEGLEGLLFECLVRSKLINLKHLCIRAVS